MRNSGGNGFSEGHRGVVEVRNMRGEAFFLVTRLTTKLIISRDGTVAGEDLHLAEN